MLYITVRKNPRDPRLHFIHVKQKVPLFSTAFIHFSTKRGTVVFSCAHSVAKWQPNTLSVKKDEIMKNNVAVVPIVILDDYKLNRIIIMARN